MNGGHTKGACQLVVAITTQWQYKLSSNRAQEGQRAGTWNSGVPGPPVLCLGFTYIQGGLGTPAEDSTKNCEGQLRPLIESQGRRCSWKQISLRAPLMTTSLLLLQRDVLL